MQKKNFIQKGVFVLLVLVSFSVAAQQKAGRLFVDQNYKGNGIAVKWIAGQLYYPNGCNVYRKTAGSDWVLLNPEPIKVNATLTATDFDEDEAYRMYELVVGKPFSEMEGSLFQGFALVKLILSSPFAEALGSIYFDEATTPGTAYQYKVEGLKTGGGTDILGTSEPIAMGTYSPIEAPKEIQLTRGENFIGFTYKPELERYYGINIYRSSGGEFTKVNDVPVVLQKPKEGRDYPEYFYQDFSAVTTVRYVYKIKAIDFFGQESVYSIPLVAPAKDFDAPASPFVSPSVQANENKVTLDWTMPEDADLSDLAGFNVYRINNINFPEDLVKLNQSLLSPEVRTFSEVTSGTGGYYYMVAALDTANNETQSTQVFVEVKDITPPKVPESFSVTADTGAIRMTWLPVNDPDLKGYFIYKSSGKEFTVVNKEPVLGDSYEEAMPKNVSSLFEYYVVAMDTSYNYSDPSNKAKAKMPDVIAPQTPFIKQVTANDEGFLVVLWMKNAESDLAGYNVYRREKGKEAWEQINFDLLFPESYKYTDRSIAENVVYEYSMQAVDQAGLTSDFAQSVGASVGLSGVAGLTPTDVALKYSTKKGVEILWKVATTDNLVGYTVYRGENGNFKPLSGRLTNQKYTDADVKSGSTYQYQIRAFASDASVLKSDAKEITIDQDN